MKLLEMYEIKDTDLISSSIQKFNEAAKAIKNAFPVGTVLPSFDKRNPSEYFGGEWTNLGAKFLYGVGGSSELGNTGGSETHQHDIPVGWDAQNGLFAYSSNPSTSQGWMPFYGSTTTPTGYALKFEEDAKGNRIQNGSVRYGKTSWYSSLPPYVRVYLWKRTR